MFPLKKKKNILKITKFLNIHPFLFVYMHNNLSTKEWKSLKNLLTEKTTYNKEQKHKEKVFSSSTEITQKPTLMHSFGDGVNRSPSGSVSENEGNGSLLLIKNKEILKVIQKKIKERGENRNSSLNKNNGLFSFRGNPRNNQFSFLFTGPILLFGIKNKNSRDGWLVEQTPQRWVVGSGGLGKPQPSQPITPIPTHAHNPNHPITPTIPCPSIQPTFLDKVKLLNIQDKDNYKNCKNVHEEIVKSAEIFKRFPSLFFLGGFYGSEDINHLEYLSLLKRKVPEVESLLISSLKNPKVLHLLNHKISILLMALKNSFRKKST